MELFVCFLPVIEQYLFFEMFFESSSFIVNVLGLSPARCRFCYSLNSLCSSIMHRYRNKSFQKTCKELLKLKWTNLNEE